MCELITASHEILPERGTARRARDGEPARLTDPTDYPVTAVCAACGREIACDRWLRGSWYHTEPG